MMRFQEKYTTASKDEKEKTLISEEAYLLCEMMQSLIYELKKRRPW